ncbi:MAG: NAD-dependent protein deacetylase [Congregibacter sp.]
MRETNPANESDRFTDELLSHLPALVLTGAGVSAGTGIPTYRDENGVWLRSKPITHQEFLQQPRQRQRYWGRSMIGWPAVRDATPSTAHRALASLELQNAITHTVTQNVDRLHQRAGSRNVTDLHGRLDRIICIACNALSGREPLQTRLRDENPHIRGELALQPDGDAELPEHLVDSVRVPGCEACGGELMPDVVFFGGSIPGSRIEKSRQAMRDARSLLVVGSSLKVYSGYRFCRWAAAEHKPVFLLNPGVTRADDMGMKWRIDADFGLQELSRLLGDTRLPPAQHQE